jgi:hypothetical protein
VDIYVHFPIRLHDVVLNYLRGGTTIQWSDIEMKVLSSGCGLFNDSVNRLTLTASDGGSNGELEGSSRDLNELYPRIICLESLRTTTRNVRAAGDQVYIGI